MTELWKGSTHRSRQDMLETSEIREHLGPAAVQCLQQQKKVIASSRRARGRGNIATNDLPGSQGRRIDLVASVSRSSGLEKAGDT